MFLRHDGKRLGLSLAVNNKSIAKIVLFAILFRFSMKNLLSSYARIANKMKDTSSRKMKLTP